MRIADILRDLFGDSAPYIDIKKLNGLDTLFDVASRRYLQQSSDYRRGLAIYLYNAEAAGLLHRDDRGRFLPIDDDDANSVLSNMPDSSGEAEGHTARAAKAIDNLPTASPPKNVVPSAIDRAAMKEISHAYTKIFDLKTRDGIPLGEIYHSQLHGRIGLNSFENAIYRGIQDLGVPPSDQQIRDYVSAKTLEEIVQRAKAEVNSHVTD